MPKIGFTGTRKGLTDKQEAEVIRLLSALSPTEFHHGDCLGADAQAHDIAKTLGIRTIIHPPQNPVYRTYCVPSDPSDVWPPREYLARNRDIVDQSDLLVACPGEATEQLRSGTWATVRYAKKLGKRVVLVLPG